MIKRSKILVVEDEADIREFILLHLKREGHDAVGVDNGEEGFLKLETGGFDLAILDWMLPGVSGLELCRKIRGKLPILMLTARAEIPDIVMGLESGADDYVVKPFDIPVLLARVGALLRRSSLVKSNEAPKRYQIGELALDLESHSAACEGQELDLTPSEFKVLSALMKNQGRVLTRENLIQLVQGEGVTVGDRTVDTHVFGLRKKLGPCSEIVETIRGVGYRIRSK